jgi:hypothetical protein
MSRGSISPQIMSRSGFQGRRRPRHTIQEKKMMMATAWNPLGFRSVESLPNGRTLNGKYYRDPVLAALIAPGG